MYVIVVIFSLLLCGYFFSLIYFSILVGKYNPKRNNDCPSLSIVVSLHNEEENVNDLMKSLLEQKYPQNKLEYIFVNDRSSDKTGKILDGYSEKNEKIKVIHINDIHKNFAPKKRAIDRAINIASGEIILLTDADARHSKSWAEVMVSYFTENVGLVMGNVLYKSINKSKKLVSKLLELEFFSISAIGISTVAMKYPATCIGTNMAIRKKVFEELNGFGKYKNIQSGDDDLFMQRVRDESSWKIEFAIKKDATVFTFPPSSFKKFHNQRLRFSSKGFEYSFKIIAMLFLYYLFNSLFIFLFIFISKYLIYLVVGIIVKIIGEYIYICKLRTKLNFDINLKIIPIASVLHIFYVLYFGMATQFQNYKWGE